MRKRIKKVETEIEVFVSEDGIEFETSKDCEAHERELAYNKRFIREIEQKEIKIPFLDCFEDEIKRTVAYRPKNIDELKVIEDYYEDNFANGYLTMLLSYIGKWIIIIEYSYDVYFFGTLDEYLNKINEFKNDFIEE